MRRYGVAYCYRIESQKKNLIVNKVNSLKITNTASKFNKIQIKTDKINILN